MLTDELDTLKVMVSADNRLAAVSKLSRVRVESSKKRLTTVLPRRAGTFGMARALTSTKLVRQAEHLLDAFAPTQIGHGQEVFHPLDHVAEDDALAADVNLLVEAGGQVLAHVVGADRKLAMTPVDHHGELHRPGPAVVIEGVEGGPHRRPVNSTSSTSTTARPVRSKGMSVTASGSTGRSPMSSR